MYLPQISSRQPLLALYDETIPIPRLPLQMMKMIRHHTHLLVDLNEDDEVILY